MVQPTQNLPAKILIVDDDVGVAQGLEEPLGRFNIKIDKGNSLETALYLFNSNRYEVVLIEVEFAPIAGLALVQRWRNHEVVDKRSCAFIMLSGNKSSEGNLGLIKELGDLEVLVKPCTAIQVLPYLSRGLSTRKRMQAFHELKERTLDYFLKTGDFDKAAEQVQKKLPELGPKGLHVLYDLYEKGQRYEEALKVVSPMLASDPSNVGLLNAKGRLLMRLGRYDEAKPCLEKCDQLAPDNIDRINDLVQAYLELKQPDRSVEKMKEVLQLHPDQTERKFEMFSKLYDHGFDEHAIQFGKETAKPMEIVRYYNNKGVLMSKGGESDAALLEYQRALRFFPRFKENYRIFYNIALAEIQKKTKESYELAKRNLKNCLELSPDFEKAKAALDIVEKALSKKAG